MKELSFKHEMVLRHLVRGATIAEAAAAAGRSSRTVFRWLQLPLFGARLREAQTEALTQSLYRLQAPYLFVGSWSSSFLPGAVFARWFHLVFAGAAASASKIKATPI